MLLYPITMEETMQFNIRLPKDLVEDMEYIAKSLKISRNHWLRVKLAELISSEIQRQKEELIRNAADKFVRGIITEQEFEHRRGFKPTKEMIEIKKKIMKQQEILQKKSRLYAKQYFDAAKKEIARLKSKR